jgi:hypothetical protein
MELNANVIDRSVVSPCCHIRSGHAGADPALTLRAEPICVVSALRVSIRAKGDLGLSLNPLDQLLVPLFVLGSPQTLFGRKTQPGGVSSSAGGFAAFG